MALVHHWALGEASGTRADSIGELDLGPTGTDSVSAAPGLIGDAFNSAAGVDSISNFVLAGRAIDIDGADCFSISMAVWFTNAAGTREVVSLYSNATTNMFLLERVVGGQFQVTVRNRADTDYVVTGTTVTIASTWYYVTATFSRNGAVMLFVNAVCEGTTPTADSPWHSVESSPRFYLGARQSDLDPMDGRIDECSIDSEALTSSAITTLYNGGALTNRVTSYVGDYTSGLVNYWNLQEASGNRADAVSGNNMSVIDDAGNAAGILGQGCVFDGDAVLNTTTPTGYNAANEATISLWARFNNAFGTREIIARSSVAAGSPLTVLFDRRETGFIDTRFWNSAAVNAQCQSTITIGPGAWHHYVMTYRRNGVQRLYIDGTSLNAPERYRDDLTIRDQSGDFQLAIGGRVVDTFFPLLDSTLDEISIYNRALTTGDVLAYYNAGSPPDLTPSGGDIRRRFSNEFFRSWT